MWTPRLLLKSPPATMSICDICGVTGFEECLTLCCRCRSSREHLYCMKNCSTNILTHWICDDCHLTIQENQKVTSRFGSSKFGDSYGTKQKPTRQTMLLSPEEVIALNTRLMNSAGSERLTCLNRKFRTVKGSNPVNQNSALLKGRSWLTTDGWPRKRVSSSERMANERNKGILAHQSRVHGPNSSDPGNHSSKNASPRGNDVEEQRSADAQPQLDKSLPNHPASIATWKGSFGITSDQPSDSCGAIIAYPPSKVARKAFEFSKRMPETLQFQLLPRHSLWADLFQDEGPDMLDIGLYFFPTGHSSQQTYAILVEHLKKNDLIMKSHISGVELLVLTSEFLDKESQMINQAYFLWGLFRPCVNTNRSVLVHPEVQQKQTEQEQKSPDNMEIVDMDIDMIGGEPVGKIDVRIPRPSKKEAKETAPKDHENGALNASTAGQQEQALVKVKTETFDDLPPPPGFTNPRQKVWQETRLVPPGFEEFASLRYKSMSQITEPTKSNL